MAARRSLLCPGQFQPMRSSPCKASSIATLRARHVATRTPLCSCRGGHAMSLPYGSPEPELVAETPGSGASGDTTAACAALPTAPSHAPASDCGDRISGCTTGKSGTRRIWSRNTKASKRAFIVSSCRCCCARSRVSCSMIRSCSAKTTQNEHHLIGADVHGSGAGESIGKIQVCK